MNENETNKMEKVLYDSMVMFDMTCTTPDFAHAIGLVSRFLANLDKEH